MSISQESDIDLVSRAQGGDAQAFSCLVERHYMLMYKVAYKWVGNRSDAQDIAQECALKLADTISSFRGDASFTTWLYRLVINVTKDFLRAQKRRAGREAPLFDDVEISSGFAGQDEQMVVKETLAAVAHLPEKTREAVILVCWEGMSHHEAAQILDCKEATVSWHVHDARKKLTVLREEGARHEKRKS